MKLPRARCASRVPSMLIASAAGAAVLWAAVWAALIAQSACSSRTSAAGRRVIVLGFDGMDYGLTRRLMEQGRMPNFARLASRGSFGPLETSVPPQSPVAWSNFITGHDPGSHGIYDFIHRDPKTMVPFLSTSRTESASRSLKVGRWQFPLASGKVELLRQGEPFWQALEEHGVRTTIVRMPANFPPSGTATRELSGMGTPDILGTYGTFSVFTTEPFAFGGQEISGGKVFPVDLVDNVVTGTLEGPDNPFLREPEKLTTEFNVYVDSRHAVAKIVVGSEERILQPGEWTDWVPVEFRMMPLQKLHGICRFYLKRISPDLELYVTPINIDPLAPALPISTPSSYAADLARGTGRFYTQGMPEDTKSLSAGVFSIDEFLRQAGLARDENERQYWQVLDEFREGLLFYYFGNLDQTSHMMWRPMDPGHPAYDEATDGPYRHVIEDLYVRFDRIVGRTLDRIDAETMLVVMSDHGFTSWRRAFHLNSWLEQQGYLAVRDPQRRRGTLFSDVDWSRTRAYGLGLNGLYINVRGREKSGIVDPSERAALAIEIGEKLLRTIDPVTGLPVVTRVHPREQVYASVRYPDITPDLIVGYAIGTRNSNQSALGEVPAEILVDNKEQWSGDHCIDHEAVPGILLTSRRLARPSTSLRTLASSILVEFGVNDFAVDSSTRTN